MRWSKLAAMLGAIALTATSLVSLVAAGYGRVAERGLDRPSATLTRNAAFLSAALAPWNSRYAALMGWIAAENNASEESLVAYSAALRWSPADPLLWVEYALALSRLDLLDERFMAVVERAQALAPEAPVVHERLAQLGIGRWQRSSAELRNRWLVSFRYELRRNRPDFLRQIRLRGRAIEFCASAAQALGEQAWCSTVARGPTR
jgi:hypothetical protein